LNKKLKSDLEHKFRNKENIFVLGWVNNIPHLLKLADILISKPGGVSVYEALTYRLPIICTSPLPTQEQANLNFLVNSGVGIYANSLEDIEKIVKNMIHNPKILQDLRIKISDLNLVTEPTRKIASFLLELFDLKDSKKVII
jgi:processive 1,2-diacylglycerol beta-glucosyltransferase